jgi:hypothetical protein
MKYFTLILLALGITAISASAKNDPRVDEALSEKIQILDVADDDYENESDVEYFVLQIKSSQTEQSADLRPTMRATVRLFDKKTKQTVIAQAEAVSKKLPREGRYHGTTLWEFEIPYGDMKSPKLEAYVVEFGMKEKRGPFMLGAIECDNAESAEEILKGDFEKVSMTCPKGSQHAQNERD